MSESVLILDDEANVRTILLAMLNAENYDAVGVTRISEAKQELKKRVFHAVLCDLKLENEDGMSFLRWVKEEKLPIPVIMLTAHGTVDTAVDAMKQGAFDFLSKPFERTELVAVLKKAVLTARYQNQTFLRSFGSGMVDLPMIGESEKLKKVLSIIEKVAPSDATVLITGESGTGKELVAQLIHDLSPRKGGPCIKINCAAIPEGLMESELFGHERGAFTGAVSTKPGRFELAEGGTLFLDEIAEMSIEMQVKLLRVLQDMSFERVGGIRTIKADVRLIAATNRDLDVEVKEGRFRQDLFYRLNVVPIVLPPLRERPTDIPMLAAVFAKKFSEKMKRPAPELTAEVLELLTQFPWPGNIRQLENVIERLIVMNDAMLMTPELLPDEILDFEEQRFLERQTGSLKEQVKEATRRIEKQAIENALAETSNNVTQAARRLNISRKGLQLKMKELGLR